MTLKVLLLNFPYKTIPRPASDISVYNSTIKDKATLHDFHAVLIDMKTVFNDMFWGSSGVAGYQNASGFSESSLQKFGTEKIKEQIETGGITFCFAAAYSETRMAYSSGYSTANNRFCSPLDLGFVSDYGDTFNPKLEELKYFNTFVKNTLDSITYECYFSKLPEKTKILGTNRAEYPVFIEVQIGKGKLVMLPRFKNMSEASTSLVYDVLPQMIQHEDVLFAPKWIVDFESN